MSPSLESQTEQFIRTARGSGEESSVASLGFAGFTAYLRFQVDPATGCELLCIASVESPERFRGRGWLWAYLRICRALINGKVQLESVVSSRLRSSLRNRPEFQEFGDDDFLMVG